MKLKYTPTVPVLQVHAIMNFWLACFNMNKDKLIDDVFEDDNDFYKKTLFVDYGGDIINFLTCLNEQQKGRLILYIIENYRGVDNKKIESSFLGLKEKSNNAGVEPTPLGLKKLFVHKGKIIPPAYRRNRLEVILWRLLFHYERYPSVDNFNRIEKVRTALVVSD